MKKILLILAIVFSHVAFAQIIKQHPVETQKQIVLPSYNHTKWLFKFTIKPGMNTTQPRQTVIIIDKSDPDWRDCFDDMNFIGVVKYDMRLKFYTSKRTRIVLRSIVTYPKPLHTIGFVYNF